MEPKDRFEFKKRLRGVRVQPAVGHETVAII